MKWLGIPETKCYFMFQYNFGLVILTMCMNGVGFGFVYATAIGELKKIYLPYFIRLMPYFRQFFYLYPRDLVLKINGHGFSQKSNIDNLKPNPVSLIANVTAVTSLLFIKKIDKNV